MADAPLSTKQLKEERAPLVTLIHQMRDMATREQRVFTAEEESNWQKLNADYDRLSMLIDYNERADKLQEQMLAASEHAVENVQREARNQGKPVPGREDFDGRAVLEKLNARENQVTPADHALALQGWARAQAGMELKAEHEEACRKTGIRPHAREFSAGLTMGDYRSFRNNLSSQDGSTGAFTVPQGFVTNLERALLLYNGVRQEAEIMRTAGGNDMPWPTVNSTSNKGRIIGENTTDSTLLEPSFGQVIFRAYKYTSDFIKVPVELLEDSAFQLASVLGDMQGEALGRIQADHFTTGNGAGQPTGIVTACISGGLTQAAASATAIAWDDIISLEHSVDPAYRGNAIFMLHDTILAAVRKLKSGNGEYLWRHDPASGAPPTINGKRYVINQSMDSTISSGQETVLFGDVSKYKIRDAGDVRMRRLEERFADTDQVAFISFLRSDGNLLNAGVAPVKVLQH